MWRITTAEDLIQSEVAKALADAWATMSEEALNDPRWDPKLIGRTSRSLGPFTLGNAKLGPIPFYSLPPIVTCPGATRFCRAYCYAIYEIVDKYAHIREAASYILSLRSDFPTIVSWYLDKLRRTETPRVVRLHVSGDFYSVDYFMKWAKIAELNQDYVFYTYTRSLEILEQVQTWPNNLIVHLSADWYNLDNVIRTYNKVRKGFITYVYTPGNRHDIDAIIRLLLETDATILIFRNHVQHAPRSKPDTLQLRLTLRSRVGGEADRVVFDPHEFHGGVVCAECKLCFSKRF